MVGASVFVGAGLVGAKLGTIDGAVVEITVVTTLRTLKLPVSAIYKLPEESTATP